MKLAIVMAGLAVALVIQGPAYGSPSPLPGQARLTGSQLGDASAWRPGEPMRFEQHGGHGGHGGGGGARGRATASRGPSNPGTGGQAVARSTTRPVFSRFRRPFFSPFAFNPFGFGFWGYDPFWWGYWGYPWAWGYPYGYGYGYGGGYGYGDGYYGGDASMRLDVKPSSAEVYVDGYFVGQVRDFNGAFHHLDVEPGAHKIEVRATGYQPLTIDVNLMAGRTVSYHGELKSGAGDDKHHP